MVFRRSTVFHVVDDILSADLFAIENESSHHIEEIVSTMLTLNPSQVLLVVPVIMVWQLRMSTKRKLGISAIFAVRTYHDTVLPSLGLNVLTNTSFSPQFGVFATVCAATRVYFQMRLLHSEE